MRKGIHKKESEGHGDRRKVWLWTGAGLGTLAAIAVGYWARKRRGEPVVSVDDVLQRCRDAANLLEDVLTGGSDSATSNGAHVR